MYKTLTSIGLLSAIVISSMVFSCKHGSETKISSHGDDESHNAGENCMSCHKIGGKGEGWFETAGTVYTDDYSSIYPNATVYLYTGPEGTGEQKYRIEVDALGNFYTTENIEFGSGLYPAVESANGIEYMESTTVSGACNGCHGVTEDPISVE